MIYYSVAKIIKNKKKVGTFMNLDFKDLQNDNMIIYNTNDIIKKETKK